MSTDDTARPSRPLPPVDHQRCSVWKHGHHVHHLQARLSLRSPGPGRVAVEGVTDDGVIHVVGREPLWHHEPERLRVVLDRVGGGATLRAHGVLAVGSYLFSVAHTPTRCAPTGRRSGESIADELLRRGGVLRPGREVLAELERRDEGTER